MHWQESIQKASVRLGNILKRLRAIQQCTAKGGAKCFDGNRRAYIGCKSWTVFLGGSRWYKLHSSGCEKISMYMNSRLHTE